jgi:Flp pilus assembly protein TadD
MLTKEDPNLRLLAIADFVHDNPGEELEPALIVYTTMIKLAPNDARGHLARGTGRARKSDFEGAVVDLTRALELEECHVAYNNRGVCHYYSKRYDQAHSDVCACLVIESKSAVALCNLGWIDEVRGETRKAISCYRRALELDPSQQAARDNLKLLRASTSENAFRA